MNKITLELHGSLALFWKNPKIFDDQGELDEIVVYARPEASCLEVDPLRIVFDAKRYKWLIYQKSSKGMEYFWVEVAAIEPVKY